MKNNYNKFEKNINNNENIKNVARKDTRDYSYYSRVLAKPFDSIEELKEAEAVYFAEQKAKEDKAAMKKADAKRVEDAFKALNVARKTYKDELTQVTVEYSEKLTELKKAFEFAKKEIHAALATAETNYSTALKAFTDKYPEGYHLTLKDGDFETTISGHAKQAGTEKPYTVNDIFEMLFNF